MAFSVLIRFYTAPSFTTQLVPGFFEKSGGLVEKFFVAVEAGMIGPGVKEDDTDTLVSIDGA